MGHPNGYRPYGHKTPMRITKDVEIIYLDMDEAIKVWLGHEIKKGRMTIADADAYWAEHHGDAKRLAGMAPAAKDSVTAARVIKDLGLHNARETVTNGRKYIVFKGNHMNRALITGTRYKVANPKIVSLGIGKAGAKNAARKGGIVSIVIVSAFNVAQFVLNDKYTLSHFLGDMATDIGIIVASTAIGLAAGAAVAGMAFVTVAAGPLIAVIVVTVGVSLLLGWAAEKLELSKKITAALDASFDYVQSQKEQAKHNLNNKVNDITADVAKLIIKAGSQVLANQLRRAIPRRRGGFQWMQF